MNARVARAAVAAVFLFAGAARPAPAASPKEEQVTSAIAGGHLSGTLLLPPGSGPFPVALIVAGLGPIDRDRNGAGLKSNAYAKWQTG